MLYDLNMSIAVFYFVFVPQAGQFEAEISIKLTRLADVLVGKLCIVYDSNFDPFEVVTRAARHSFKCVKFKFYNVSL